MWSRTFLFVLCALAWCGTYAQDSDTDLEYFNVPEGDSYDDEDYEEPDNGLIADMSESGCDCISTLCQCCANAKINQNEHQFCVVGGFVEETMSLTIRIIVNFKKFWEHSISAKKIELCAPLPLPPPLSFFKLCLGTYDWALVLKEERAHVCIYALLKAASFAVFSVDFNCLQYLRGVIDFRTDIKFSKQGLFHLNLNGLNPEFSFNLPDLLKTQLQQKAKEIEEGYNKCETGWQKAGFIAKTAWEMTPAYMLIEGAKEVGPMLKGAAEWVVNEAMDSIKSIAREWAAEMEGMSLGQRTKYIAEKLWAFTPINLLKKGIEAITPFIKSAIQFASQKLSEAFDSLRAEVATKLKEWGMQAEQLYEDFKESLRVAGAVLGDVVNSVADSITTGFKKLGDKIVEVANRAYQFISNIDLKAFLDKMMGPASPLVLVGKELEKVGQYIVEKVNDAVEVVKEVAVKAVQAVERAVATVKEYFWSWFG